MTVDQGNDAQDGLWLTLNEALARISAERNLSPIDAQLFLKRRIAAEIILTRWGSRGRLKRDHRPYCVGAKLSADGLGCAFDPENDIYKPMLVGAAGLSAEIEKTGAAFHKSETAYLSTKRRTRLSAFPISKWMTLVEASEHIQSTRDYDEATANQQLEKEIKERSILTRYWNDEIEDKETVDVNICKFIYSKYGCATEPDEDSGNDVCRTLLIDRQNVLKLWFNPKKSNLIKVSDASPARKKTRSAIFKRDVDETIRVAARKLYVENPIEPPNVNVAIKALKKEIIGSNWKQLKKVLDEKEFEEKGRKPGQRRKPIAE